MRIAATDKIDVYYDDRGTDLCLALFNELSFQPGGEPYWGAKLTEKLGLSAVGIVSRTPNWFPAADMRQVAPAIREAMGKSATRVGYGASMGGYAAIKYSGLLATHATLAISPQVSIDPRDVGGFERRYLKYFDPALHDGMAIRADDLAGRIHSIFDPKHVMDAEHARRIQALDDSVGGYHAYFTDHATIHCFASTSVVEGLLLAASYRSEKRLRAIVAQRRRAPKMRRLILARHLMNRHPAVAETMVGAFMDAHPVARLNPTEEALLFGLGRHLHRAGRLQGAERVYRQFLRFRRYFFEAFAGIAEIAIPRGDASDLAEIAADLEAKPQKSDAVAQVLERYHALIAAHGKPPLAITR